MFRFTIRDVLWLTVVAAIGLAGIVNRSQLIKRHEQSLDEVFEEELVAVTRYHTLCTALEREGYDVDWDEENATVTLVPRKNKAEWP